MNKGKQTKSWVFINFVIHLLGNKSFKVFSQKQSVFHSNVIPVKKNKILCNEGEKFNIKRQVSGVYIFLKNLHIFKYFKAIFYKKKTPLCLYFLTGATVLLDNIVGYPTIEA